MIKKQSTTKGFAILGMAGMINKVLALIYVPALTFFIGDYGNGIYNAGYMMYIFIFVITNTGMPVAISKLVSEQIALKNYQNSYKIFKMSAIILISLGFITSILGIVFAKKLSNIVGWPEAYLTILALSPTLLFTAISCTFRGYFQGTSNMIPTAVSQIIEQLINSILTVIFAWVMLKYGISYAMNHGITNPREIKVISLEFAAAGGTIGTSVGAMGSALYLFLIYLKNKKSVLDEINQNKTFGQTSYSSKEIVKQILKYSVPITIGAVAVYLSNLIDLKYTKSRLIFAGFSAYEANSLYGILTTQFQKILNIPLALASALSVAIIPGISTVSALKDNELLGKKINESFKAIFVITIPAAIGLAVLAKPIITLLFPRNINGVDLMMMGTGVLVLISGVQVQTAILQGMGKTYLPTIHMIIALIIKIIINYNLIAVKTINIRGAVIGSIVCYSLAGILNHVSIKKYSKVSLEYKKVLVNPVLSAIPMGAVAFITYNIVDFFVAKFISSFYLANAISTIVAILFAGLAYFVGMLVLKAITIQDIKRLPMSGKILSYINKYNFIKKRLGDNL